MIKIISALLVLTILSSCATLTGSRTYKVHINSNIEGAKITVESVGTYTTPVVVKLRGRLSYKISAEKECYKTNSVSIYGKKRVIPDMPMGGMSTGDISDVFVFGGIVVASAMFLDYISGASYTLPRKVFIKLELEEDFGSEKCRERLNNSVINKKIS